jgi:hypothetical protein
MTETDPLALLANSIDKLAGSIDTALEEVRGNAADLADARSDLGRWQTTVVILAVLVVGGLLTLLAVGSYWEQADCDRTNDARRILNEDGDVKLPLRDCSWPA